MDYYIEPISCSNKIVLPVDHTTLKGQIWDRDELLSFLKYEPEIRNNAILTLLWDLDARNHDARKVRFLIS